MDERKDPDAEKPEDEAEARKASYVESYAEAGFVGPINPLKTLGEGERPPETEGAARKLQDGEVL